jgi:hypothetical protein
MSDRDRNQRLLQTHTYPAPAFFVFDVTTLSGNHLLVNAAFVVVWRFFGKERPKLAMTEELHSVPRVGHALTSDSAEKSRFKIFNIKK